MPRVARRRDAHLLRAPAALAAAALMLALAGCGEGEADDPVKAAEARVQAKEKALDDAKADFEEKSEEFCGASEDYVTSLDRYGDVLTETTTTVGDVRDAGVELEKPRDQAMEAAETAVEAQLAVADARQELAEAEVALALAKDPSAETPVPAPSSPEPLAPAATVDRVEQAEKQFATAQEGITDATPLSQASQQFNAAAVALEMSWLRLFADAGCLSDEQAVQAESAVREYTVALQQSLSDAGYFDGEVDGVYGPSTVDAVKALQQASELPVTGVVDKATAAALQADLAAQGGASAQEDTASTAALQQTLRLAGFWDGPVDGEWTPELTDALEDFQDELGVESTGTVDAATVAALEKAIAEAQEEDEESPSRTSVTASPSASPPSD